MGGQDQSNFGLQGGKYPIKAQGPIAKRFHPIYKDRLDNFFADGQYARDNLRSKLHEAKVSNEPHVVLSVYSPPDLSRPSFKEATGQDFLPTKLGKSFGPSWSTHWFKVQILVPATINTHEHLEFHWNANNEGLIWSEDGEPLQGLTGGGEREEWILPGSFRDGKQHTIYIEMACNGMFGNPPGGDIIQPPDPDKTFVLEKAEIVAVNLEARALFYDFWIIKDAAQEFSEESRQQHQALEVCTEIMNEFERGQGSQSSLLKCRQIAHQFLVPLSDPKRLYDDTKDGHVQVFAIGNCHIDTCWLWPWDETKRKIARSWSNQCDLLDRYPEHVFACSQAQQFKWLKMYYPSLWDRVKTQVKKGGFQPIGGSWVEHDTNLPSGESLVRQFLYGQRFFESHFGERSKTFWLPDTFGYSSQLPQLCRKAGMTRFFTQKLSWNNINSFPHTTFNWVSLDGSQVLCHMAPCETYTAEAHFGDVKRSETQHKSMDADCTSILPFGKGDGGGGPTFEHLEKLRRCRALSDSVGLLPRVTVGYSVDDFFARLEARTISEKSFNLPTWYGELYFELHRGTYTTQAKMKQNNRRAEIMLHDIEFVATMASLKWLFPGTAKSDYSYPKEQLDGLWEKVLLCQFHDCLPGSCIEMCYDDAHKLYGDVFYEGSVLLQNALKALGFEWIKDRMLHKPQQRPGKTVIVTTMRWERADMLRFPVNSDQFKYYGVKNVHAGLCQLSNLPLPWVNIRCLDNDVYQLENRRLAVTLVDGLITSMYDKAADREIIPNGAKANQYVIFDDKPLYWQAWDVEVYHLESRTELKPFQSILHETSDGVAAIEYLTRISDDSTISTIVSLAGVESVYSSSYIDIQCRVQWAENKKFLKVEFPVDITNTEASYETQYGIIRRPTHYNTSWDMAKFEVCTHKWADLSEATYGVSILNDNKYGFATQGNIMRLSLLRSPKAPDAHADMGVHTFRYGIFPHIGPLGPQTIRTAYDFNSPFYKLRHHTDPRPVRESIGFSDPSEHALAPYVCRHESPEVLTPLLGSIRMSPNSSDAIIISCIKRGEDDKDVSRGELPRSKDTSIIVRLYDSMGGKCRGWVQFGHLPVRQVRQCNLLEDDGEEVPIDRNARWFRVDVGTFEVQTYRLIIGLDYKGRPDGTGINNPPW